MKIAGIALGLMVLVGAGSAQARLFGGHHGAFGGGPHGAFGGGPRGHSINAWMGSHRPRLR